MNSSCRILIAADVQESIQINHLQRDINLEASGLGTEDKDSIIVCGVVNCDENSLISTLGGGRGWGGGAA